MRIKLISYAIRFVVLALAVANGSLTFGQDKTITKAEFWEYMRASQGMTREKAFRETVSVETAPGPDGPWEPYSSWVRLCVFPDRSHLTYTSRTNDEIIHIGKLHYSRKNGGDWVMSEMPAPRLVNPPAGLFGSPETAEIKLTRDRFEDGTFEISITHLPPDILRKSTFSYKKGVFVKSVSIAFLGGDHWLRRQQAYEYDDNISVVAPLFTK